MLSAILFFLSASFSLSLSLSLCVIYMCFCSVESQSLVSLFQSCFVLFFFSFLNTFDTVQFLSPSADRV
jgi:hypothetical protein